MRIVSSDRPDRGSPSATRTVPIGLSPEHRLVLANELSIWRDGCLGDLETPDRLEDPDRTRRRVQSYERLITALLRGEIELPDEEARGWLRQAADGLDREEDWKEQKLHHDLRRALLAALDGVGGAVNEATDPAPPTPEWTTANEDQRTIESAVLRRLLAVHPAALTVEELIRELAGEEADVAARDAIERAAHDLSDAGLVHLVEEIATPTRAAFRLVELIDQ